MPAWASHLFKRYHHFMIYGLMGGLTVLVDYGTFFVLFQYMNASLFIANAAGLLIGFIVSFIGNRTLVFGTNKQNTHHPLAKQILLYVILLTFNTFLSYGVIEAVRHLGIMPVIGKGIAVVAIAVWNYIIYKKIIFKKKPGLSL